MNKLIKTIFVKVILTLLACPLNAIARVSSHPMENSPHTAPYLSMSGYILARHSDISPVITAHFDHCVGTPLAREKRMAKGILIGNNRVLAPADYFIAPWSMDFIVGQPPNIN